MKNFTRHDKTMAYQDVGTGPVLLLGHAFLCDSTMWRPQVEALSEHYRCIIPDFWAHGHSDTLPNETRSLINYADDMLALMDHLGIENFSVIGHSMGGVWGTELVLKAPSRVSSLVLMDVFLGFEPEITKEKYFKMLDTVAATKAFSQEVAEDLTHLYFGAEKQDALLSSFNSALADISGDKAQEIANVGRMVFERRDTFEDAEVLTLPTLILVGAEDKMRSPLESMLMHDGIDGSEYTLIPSAGHLSNLEQPSAVNLALTTFLSRHIQ